MGSDLCSVCFVVTRCVLREHPPFSRVVVITSIVYAFLGIDIGTVVEDFKRNLRLPFTPPLVTVSGPSDVDCEGESENRRIRLRETAVDHS